MLHQHHQQYTYGSLDLDGRQLANLDSEDLSGTCLQKISLYNNCLTRFPEQIFHHRN
ncbi:adenylate cyclase, partial [Serratia fonticola]|nr:adenylate cyclase [Serratia fonticola]